MRAHEILNELSVPDSRKAAVRRLWDAGYQYMGDGAFASVYAREGDPFVLKLFDNIDTAFPAFVALAMAHQANLHFPRYRGRLMRVAPGYSAVRMERLTPYHYDSSMIGRYMRHRDHLPPPGQRDPNSYTQMQWEDAEEFMEGEPTLKEACDLIIDHLGTQYRIDISDNNLMMRGRTVVIIDPVTPLSW
jgi:hypothetical protein